jgi:methyltransferase
MVKNTLVPYLVLLCAIALERLYELVLSHRHARIAFERGAIEAGRGHFTIMRLFHAAFLVSCAAEVLLFKREVPGVWSLAFFAGALDAQALRYWALATLGERWNVRILVIPGEPPVTAGPYRWLRHPSYLAVVMEMFCIPMIHGAYATAIAFSAGNAALLWVRIRTEERALGPDYEKLFAKRRRLVPRPPAS